MRPMPVAGEVLDMDVIHLVHAEDERVQLGASPPQKHMRESTHARLGDPIVPDVKVLQPRAATACSRGRDAM